MGSYRAISNPDILDQVQSVNTIYLCKLEYKDNIGHIGTLTVKDSSGCVLQTTWFDGRVAEFEVPLQMVPEERYTFNLSGDETRHRHNYSYYIKDNGLISGQMVNRFINNCVFHYWK